MGQDTGPLPPVPPCFFRLTLSLAQGSGTREQTLQLTTGTAAPDSGCPSTVRTCTWQAEGWAAGAGGQQA